jgi:hypothetical protein
LLDKNVIREFVEKFVVLDGRKANILIKHLLYGNQKLNRCVLHPFSDEERIGLLIEDEDRYITMDELCEVGIDDMGCYLRSEVMELYILF